MSHSKEFVFNLMVHVTVLWWFLTSFFYFYVRHIESEQINDSVKRTLTPLILENVQDMQQQYDDTWEKQKFVNRVAQNYSATCDPRDLDLERDRLNTNWTVMSRAVVIGLLFTVFTVVWYLLFRDEIPLMAVLAENLLVFILIGTFEFIFFTKYALSYYPVSPDEMSTLVQKQNLRF